MRDDIVSASVAASRSQTESMINMSIDKMENSQTNVYTERHLLNPDTGERTKSVEWLNEVKTTHKSSHIEAKKVERTMQKEAIDRVAALTLHKMPSTKKVKDAISSSKSSWIRGIQLNFTKAVGDFEYQIAAAAEHAFKEAVAEVHDRGLDVCQHPSVITFVITFVAVFNEECVRRNLFKEEVARLLVHGDVNLCKLIEHDIRLDGIDRAERYPECIAELFSNVLREEMMNTERVYWCPMNLLTQTMMRDVSLWVEKFISEQVKIRFLLDPQLSNNSDLKEALSGVCFDDGLRRVEEWDTLTKYFPSDKIPTADVANGRNAAVSVGNFQNACLGVFCTDIDLFHGGRSQRLELDEDMFYKIIETASGIRNKDREDEIQSCATLLTHVHPNMSTLRTLGYDTIADEWGNQMDGTVNKKLADYSSIQ